MSSDTRSQSQKRKLLAVDLDGTLYKGNTLHLYIHTGLSALVRRGRLDAWLRCAWFLGLRKLGLVDHRGMKFPVVRCLQKFDSHFLPEFSSKVKAGLNPKVVEMIETYRDRGFEVLLATAAADSYVSAIWEGDYVATTMNPDLNPERIECRGAEKVRRIEEYCASRGLVLKACITDDSVSDGPLLSASEEPHLL